MTIDYLQQVWNNDLDFTMDETTWAELWQLAKEISICNRTRESQFRILHRLQITPRLRHKMNLSLTEMCSKCHVEVGSYMHCVWSCVHIEGYWGEIIDKLNLIFDVHLNPGPEVLLLGLPSLNCFHFATRPHEEFYKVGAFLDVAVGYHLYLHLKKANFNYTALLKTKFTNCFKEVHTQPKG